MDIWGVSRCLIHHVHWGAGRAAQVFGGAHCTLAPPLTANTTGESEQLVRWANG